MKLKYVVIVKPTLVPCRDEFYKNIKKAKSSNPVFILDEIDKVGNHFHGDPSSALLEVLDPELNNAFYDNFVEMDYDLSKVMFIATANSLSTIQPALRDRLEIIDVTGYTVEEKIQMGRSPLIPKQLEDRGIKKRQLVFEEKIIEKIIEDYTRESGVRGLEKQIAKVVRHIAKAMAMKDKYNNGGDALQEPVTKTVVSANNDGLYHSLATRRKVRA